LVHKAAFQMTSPPPSSAFDPTNAARSVAAALAFVEAHGVVLEAAKGAAPRLIDAIAGQPIRGNWWSHPQANAIYNVLTEVRASEHVLVCRLVNGKVTLVHSRLWPALVKLAARFAPQQIAQVREEHTQSGRHVVSEVLFPQWVPPEVAHEANVLPLREATSLLAPWLPGTPKKTWDGLARRSNCIW